MDFIQFIKFFRVIYNHEFIRSQNYLFFKSLVWLDYYFLTKPFVFDVEFDYHKLNLPVLFHFELDKINCCDINAINYWFEYGWVELQITIADYHMIKIIIKVVIIHIKLYWGLKKNYKYFCYYQLDFLKSFILKYMSIYS